MTLEQLFAFAAKYWYVVVVLIGIAASAFSKRMEPQRRSGRAGEGGMPSFGGGGSGSPFGSPRRADAPAVQPRRGLEAPAAEAWPAKQVAAPPAGAPAVSAAAKAGSAGEAARAAAAAELRRGPDAHALAQGVLWAEILGPPRAKKPRIR